MKAVPLTAGELDMLRKVFRQHPKIVSASLFGSRAKGTHTERSDVDLALAGDVATVGSRGHRSRIRRASATLQI